MDYQSIIFYIVLWAVVIGLVLFLRYNPKLKDKIKNIISIVKDETIKLEKEARDIIGDGAFNMMVTLTEQAYKGREQEIIKLHNEAFETKFTDLEDVLIDKLIRRINSNGKKIITAEQAKFAIQVISTIVKNNLK
jgi:hypothetical protein